MGKKKQLRLVWTPDPTREEGSGEKPYPEVSAIGVDEGRRSLQPTSVRVRLMTGSEYMVEHRYCGIPAEHFRARLFPRPLQVGSGVQTKLCPCFELRLQSGRINAPW